MHFTVSEPFKTPKWLSLKAVRVARQSNSSILHDVREIRETAESGNGPGPAVV